MDPSRRGAPSCQMCNLSGGTWKSMRKKLFIKDGRHGVCFSCPKAKINFENEWILRVYLQVNGSVDSNRLIEGNFLLLSIRSGSCSCISLTISPWPASAGLLNSRLCCHCEKLFFFSPTNNFFLSNFPSPPLLEFPQFHTKSLLVTAWMDFLGKNCGKISSNTFEKQTALKIDNWQPASNLSDKKTQRKSLRESFCLLIEGK